MYKEESRKIKRDILQIEEEIMHLKREKTDLEVELTINNLYEDEQESDYILDSIESLIKDLYEEIMDLVGIRVESGVNSYLNEHVWNTRDSILTNIKKDTAVFELKEGGEYEN